jgi:hypothetical protein
MLRSVTTTFLDAERMSRLVEVAGMKYLVDGPYEADDEIV